MSNVNSHSRTLYLMRHAAASMDAVRDFDRPLTAMGERDARHMGRWFNQTQTEPDKIIASAALRAKTTAQILMEELHQQHTLHLEEELYEASVRTFLQIVNQLNNSHEKVLIVAHNPAVTYLADYLTSNGLEAFAPGTIVGLKFEVDTWESVSQHAANLLCYQSPNQL